MKVEFGSEKNNTTFDELTAGQTFMMCEGNYADNRVFMVVRSEDKDDWNAVCLMTGSLFIIGEVCLVKKVDAKVVVE